jgi:hypothetical protein
VAFYPELGKGSHDIKTPKSDRLLAPSCRRVVAKVPFLSFSLRL